MTIVAAPGGTLSFTFRDRNKNVSSMSVNVANDLVSADVTTVLAGALGTALAAILDSTLLGATYSQKWTETNPAVPPIGSDVERKGVFTFRDANGKAVVVQVPSFKSSLVLDGTNEINIADTGVAAFIAYMEAGIVGVAQPQSAGGADIVALVSAEKHHRASSKG